jgi:hypothetical protein
MWLSTSPLGGFEQRPAPDPAAAGLVLADDGAQQPPPGVVIHARQPCRMNRTRPRCPSRTCANRAGHDHVRNGAVIGVTDAVSNAAPRASAKRKTPAFAK